MKRSPILDKMDGAAEPGTERRRLGLAASIRTGKMPGRYQLIAWIPVMVLAVAFAPTALSFAEFDAAVSGLILVLYAYSISILFGWSGLTSFGQAAFFGCGCYVAALLANDGAHPLVGLLSAIGAAGLLAFVVAIAAIRSPSLQFAIWTLVAGQVLWLLTFKVSWLGGENGLRFEFGRGEILGQDLADSRTFTIYCVAVVAVIMFLLWRLHQSVLGNVFNAVRDNSDRAAALGISVTRVKVAVFVIAGVVAGASGCLYSQLQYGASQSYIYWEWSGIGIVIAALGGLGYFYGPVVGAFGYSAIRYYITGNAMAPSLYIGLAFVLIVALMPDGLLSLPRVLLRSLGRRAGHKTEDRQP